MSKYYVTVKYGVTTPFETRLWEYKNSFYRCIGSFYHDAKIAGYPMTDEECYEAMVDMVNECLMGTDYSIETILVDPAAASFIKICKNHGDFKVTKKYPYTDIDQIIRYQEDQKALEDINSQE
jgi:hypothetical protein